MAANQNCSTTNRRPTSADGVLVLSNRARLNHNKHLKEVTASELMYLFSELSDITLELTLCMFGGRGLFRNTAKLVM